MTCEIAIMNKQAVVLAADSATTVTQWADGQKEVRYFKGSNKIFQISDYQPIGLMIYATANVQGVPWDVIAKAFREHLGRKSFNDIDGYARELFDFIKGHPQLFPTDFQRTSFLKDGAQAATLHFFFEVLPRAKLEDAASDGDRAEIIKGMFDDELAAIDEVDLPKQFEQLELDEALAAHTDELAELLSSQLENYEYVECIDFTKLASLAIKLLVKSYSRYMDSTGVVIAGYGDNDYFPAYREYHCYGVLLGKFLFDSIDGRNVTRDTPSLIKPFATTAMVNTFVVGFNEDVYSKVREETTKTLNSFAESLVEKGIDLGEDLDDRVADYVTSHTDAWCHSTAANHARPLQRVIGSLPIDEMADLAETLIMLESLKEKVTQPTESVGGPIDVCVISKYDGFIWIKRKHYFAPELNPYFFRRQSAKFD